jgi:hypothetical protein
VEGIKLWKICCWKFKQKKKGFWRENELSAFTLVANNTCYIIYPWRKATFFVLSLWYFPNHGVLGYVMECIIKKFSMNRGAPTWFIMFGTIMWNLFIIAPFFHWIFWKNKIENYIGIWGHFWYCWKAFTKFEY